jgi:hypothetical protein
VVWLKFTDVSEVLAATIIRAIRPGDGGSKYLRNVGQFLQYYTAQNPRRLIFTVTGVEVDSPVAMAETLSRETVSTAEPHPTPAV